MKLFSVRGIEVRLHVTFPLIILWAALQFGLLDGNVGSALVGVLAIIFLFILVTLHELGHSFAAQYYGVPVRQIILSPLGGLAQLNKIPEQPIQEFVISIAGPAVNFAIAILMGLLSLIIGLDLRDAYPAIAGGIEFSPGVLFSYIFIYNIFLAVFNLIPAFPLDGGRVLRSLLAMRIDYARATNIAAAVGKAFAVALGLWGLLNGGIFLVFIAVFIYTGASQEAAHVTLRSRLRSITVGQVYAPAVHRLNSNSTLQQAANLMIYTGQKSFPVVEGEQLVGFVDNAVLVKATRTLPPYTPVSSFMRRGVQGVKIDEDLFEVYERFGREQVDAIPVSSNGRFLGLIKKGDLADLHRLLSATPNVIVQEQSA